MHSRLGTYHNKLTLIPPKAKATEIHGSLSISPSVYIMCGWISATMVLSRAKRNNAARREKTTKNQVTGFKDRGMGGSSRFVSLLEYSKSPAFFEGS